MPVAMAGERCAGRVALVTGASRGIGRGIALAFANEGCDLMLTARDAGALDEVAAAIRAKGRKAAISVVDLRQPEAPTKVVEDLKREFGGLDILINNAGLSLRSAIDDDGYDEAWTRALAVMLTAHPRIIRAALPHLRQSRCPRIVNIASTEALGATATNSPYAAAKAGVTGLTRALAVELGREGITVNCICPGPIRTGITERIAEEHKTIFAKRRTALGRYGDPEEVAHMTLSLCLPAASYLTGVVIPVDGGLMARNA